MNIVIVGQGAIGLLWYHHLSKSNENKVRLLCSKRVSKPPSEVLFTDIKAMTVAQPLALASTETLANADIILICVKSYSIESVISAIKNNISANTSLVFCHNGMLDKKQFRQLSQPCYSLLTTHGSKIIRPFHVAHTGLGDNDIGLFQGDANANAQEKLINCLSQALPKCNFTDDIKSKQWLKLAINCVINPLTAIYDIDNGQVCAQNYSTSITNILEEVILIARQDGVNFDLKALTALILDVAQNTATNCSSMRSDIHNNRATEIDYINGYVVNIAKKFNLNAKHNAQMVKQVKSLSH